MEWHEAVRLQRDWEAKGSPACDHPNVERESIRGRGTGDEVCTSCGASAPRGKVQLKETGEEGCEDGGSKTGHNG